MTIQDALNLYETGNGGRLENWIDSLSIGGQTTIIGLAIVFAVLIILMFVLKIMEKIFAPKTEKKAEIVPPVSVVKQTEIVAAEDDEEIIAVLTAAIAASLNTSTYNLRIKSFRRVVNNAPAWNKAGLNETINSRF